MKFRLLSSLVLFAVLVACTPAADPADPTTQASGDAPQSEAEATQVEGGYVAPEEEAEPAAVSGGEIVITATDACALVTQEQVEAAFGKPVTEVNPNTQTIGTGCEYQFNADTDTELQISFYEGDTAKHYLAGLVAASQESCDSFYERLFDIAFGDNPDSGQDVAALSMSDLYRQYLAIFENCPSYVHSEERPDVAPNVLATELIVFNWSSSVAVLGDERVVELTYQEPISTEAEAAFQNANDRDSFYAAAQPFADGVLARYTEILIGLLQEAAGR